MFDTPNSELPSGMLTVMFTDIEGSTPQWEHAADAMRVAMRTHDEVLNTIVSEHEGIVFKHTGDGVGAVFTSPDRAAIAAVEIQRSFQTHDWVGVDRVKVRIGLHMGDIEPTDGDYFGPPVNRAARIMDVANGDQTAVSGVVSRFVRSVETRRMGAHQLKGIGTEMIELLVDEDLVIDNRPLRARVSSAIKSLPAPAHPLIGRADALDEALGLIDRNQIVTVLGPGGVGKTHFALELGRAAQHRFADGAVLCELAPVSDPSAVLDVIAESIGARVQPDMSLPNSILNFLDDRQLLIILDHCEHVIDAANDFVEMIAPLPEVKVVSTSRERLGLRSEQVFGLEPLDPDSDAVTLFLERARERDLSFNPDAAGLETIARICQRLDGIPLGVELAAAWVRVLTPDQLLERLADRFEVLERTRSRGHRQTLRETVQWSYDQLGSTQKRLFERLSVFAGGFSLEAAIEVCAAEGSHDADVLDTMMGLVDKSMVMTDRGSGQIRFTMLGTLTQFGSEQLAESGELHASERRHADYFLALVSTESTKLVTPREAEVWDSLTREWANIRAAFSTLTSTAEFGLATNLVLDLGWFATLALRSELFVWVEELHNRDGFKTDPGASSILGLVAISKYLTVDERSPEYANAGLELDSSDPYGFCQLALAANSLNNVHDAAASETRTLRWLDSLTDSSPMLSRQWALGMRVFHLCTHAPSPDAATYQAEMLQIATETGSASAMALARWAGGMVATFEGMDAGRAEWRKGIDNARSINDLHLLVHLIVGLELHFTASRGDVDQVLDRCQAILKQAHAHHYLTGASHLFGVTAIILARVDQAEIGAELLGSMIAHGHIPRSNAQNAIDNALGDHAESAIARGYELSTNKAAALAIDTLQAVIERRRLDPAALDPAALDPAALDPAALDHD